ncbi:MAG: hypothetical protein A2W75_06770 [Nitrospinae bacterium RIFCSPLOWO2_12_39_15]|nr:MAG: hypothetical protein A2W75_06770 [Nitrospinae bacterium RIFCSPLOWO2_12_39_15]
MNDTTPEIERRFQEMMMKKIGQERLKMGFSMFDMARKQVISSIIDNNPEADLRNIKKGIFIRFYGQEFSKEE